MQVDNVPLPTSARKAAESFSGVLKDKSVVTTKLNPQTLFEIGKPLAAILSVCKEEAVPEEEEEPVEDNFKETSHHRLTSRNLPRGS